MSVIRVISSTMGVSSPASVAVGTGYYVYKGDQPYIPPAPAKPLPQNVKTIAGKQARIAKYIRLRLDGRGQVRGRPAARRHPQHQGDLREGVPGTTKSSSKEGGRMPKIRNLSWRVSGVAAGTFLSLDGLSGGYTHRGPPGGTVTAGDRGTPPRGDRGEVP